MRIKTFIILSAILSVCSGVLSANGQTPPRLYNEPVSKSNPLRTEQARELEGYIATLRKDTSRLRLLLKPDYSSPKAFDRSTESYRKTFAASSRCTVGEAPLKSLSLMAVVTITIWSVER